MIRPSFETFAPDSQVFNYSKRLRICNFKFNSKARNKLFHVSDEPRFDRCLQISLARFSCPFIGPQG